MAQAFDAPHAADFTPPVPAACAVSTICAKPVNFAHIASPISDCAIAAQSAPGNSGNAHSHGRSRKNRTSHEYAQPTNFSSAPLGTAREATKARWSFDPRNGVPLRAPLELYIPKSEWNFSPYTGYAWSQPPQQYAPLNQNNHSSTQQASCPSTQNLPPRQSASVFSAPLPLPFFPATSSGNYPVAPPAAYTDSVATQHNHKKKSNRSTSIVNAVHSAGRGAPQLIADVQLCDATVA